MCSRYEIRAAAEELARRFLRLRQQQIVGCEGERSSFGEIRPTDQAPIVTREGRMAVKRWGLAAPWTPKPVINARVESISEKSLFRPLLENRCLVPATAYFDWRRRDRAKEKIRVRPAVGPIAFAGLYDAERFVIMTCQAAPDVASIHDRMPVIIDSTLEDAWLDPRQPFGQIQTELRPWTGRLICETHGPTTTRPTTTGQRNLFD